MPLYRCQNSECSTDPHGRLIFDFEAAEPRCPKCGADSRRPEHKFVVVKREVIHLHIEDAKGPDAGFGKRRRIACDPKGSICGKHATAEARAVTCPTCKASREWVKAAMENEFATPADLDFPVELDADGKAILGTPPDKKPNDCGCGGGT